ncbi:MAG: filamentous hemagglutinin N-terminal domain-containing protein [Rivularia sp. T60_A2020_040]|nr:filamentous hemagglutinin N-terminal domain-containing protein [Rivularia sp. T60_A2020_040]
MKDANCNSLWTFSLKVLLGFLSVSVTSIEPGFAQSNIVPDNTLGIESSQINNNNVNRNGIPSTLIEGGAERGQNLFHSLQEFNVGEGRGAYFVVPNDNIQNVLTRVTGNNPSEILGILGTISNRNFDPSNANLFLINPNGIVFGENASLDINGSFVGTTANGIQFGEQGFFSANNPETTPLLTVNPSAFLFSQIKQTASIQSASVVPAGENLSGNSLRGLRVGDRKSLLLLGGNLSIDGGGEEGGVSAIGGRVELGGLASLGTVGLNTDGNNLSLSFPDGVARSDVALSNSAKVVVPADDGGSIAISSRNFELIEGSSLLAGIAPGLGFAESQAGNIQINATGIVVIDGISNGFLSGAFNQVEAGSTGNSGQIEISADSVEVKNGGQLNAGTLGKGNSGRIQINATDRVVFNGAPFGFRSSAFSQVAQNAVGNSGGIEINAGNNVDVSNGAFLDASTLGRGDAGKIQITTDGNVVFDGESALGFQSSAISQVAQNAVGNSGGIEINAGNNVDVSNGAFLDASTLGRGDAGKIQITTDGNVVFDGESALGFQSSAISQVAQNAVGNSGGIEINAGNNVDVSNGAFLDASTLGRGDAGKIQITTDGKVMFDGESRGGFLSSAFSQVKPGTVGNSGGIAIEAGSVEVSNGAFLDASTLGEGNSGAIQIISREGVVFNGESKQGNRSSAISQVGENAVGNSGGIEINAGNNVDVSNGAFLDASTLGRGDAGKIQITTDGKVMFDGESRGGFLSSAFSQVKPGTVGNSGGIAIEAGSVEVSNGAFLDASTLGEGNSGAIQIISREGVVFNGESKQGNPSFVISQLTAEAIGNSGGIVIEGGNVEISNGAFLDSSTLGKGNSGAIQITGRERVVFDGESKSGNPSSAINQVTQNAVGSSGGIMINTSIFELTKGAQLTSSTLGLGNPGRIQVNARNQVVFDGKSRDGSRSSAATSEAGSFAVGDSEGIIQINTSTFKLTDTAFISANTLGVVSAGNITVNSLINFELTDGSKISAQSTGIGEAGNIEINSPKITLDNQGRLNAESTSGNGGNINLNVGELLLLRRGSQITTNAGTAQQGGNGGNITINAPNGFIVGFPKENSDITANAFTGNGGNVEINSRGIFGIERRTEQTAQSDITASSQLGVAGNVNLNAPDNSDIQNSLTELLKNPIDSEALIASSCVVRSRERNGTFFITGSQGFPYRPGDAVPSVYSTIGVQSVPNSISEKPRRRWKIGDPIVEPSGVYRLENGQRILSRECMK